VKQDLQQFIGIRLEGLTNLDEFQDVDTPFAAFIFGDKRLRPAKSLGEFFEQVYIQSNGFALIMLWAEPADEDEYDRDEPPGVLHSQRTIDSLEKENAWLKEQLVDRI
jgi:hypothetical protein